MNSIKVLMIMLMAGFFLFIGEAKAEHSAFVKEFMRAYDAKNIPGMGELVKSNKATIPAEVRALTKEALKKDTAPEDKTANFFIGELIAREYNNLTEDATLLIELKQEEFNSNLHEAVRAKADKGIVTVEIPAGTEKEKNIFTPDHIIINEGETVRWKNNDTVAHIFASMPLIGQGGIFTPSIEGGATWEFKFDKPGEYYYLCFIHKGMIGKITVLASEKPEVAPAEKPVEKGKKDTESEKHAEE
ncbi:MAG: plastocyanin/azurin family copper-binding protein [Thermodesulfobacteriota bacterium]